MSSTYRILCLSHDPAVATETPDTPEYHRPEQAEDAIHNGIEGHTTCDLAIGRYSYPLVELGCPPSRDQPADLPCCHGTTIWTDTKWLILLAAAYQSDEPAIQQALSAGHHGCHPWERLQRLRNELNLPNHAAPAGDRSGGNSRA
ncbi:hypothetical protein [Streptomyces sp. NPDC008150]|uniref:hypothetical protein n=1 Tax=Streptomyces sp. NPDC008150 TaxID=3364816 RepID=UPI0036E29FEA